MDTTETDGTAEDELYVLTAVLLTPARFPAVLGDDYPEACAALALEAYAEGYGLLLGQDGTGARWTVAIEDVTLTACAIAAWDCGMSYDLSPDENTVAAVLPGWPLALSVRAPGVPAPHDPVPDPGHDFGCPLLTAPDPEKWGPAQRRLGADEIALQWTQWREQVSAEAEFIQPGEAQDEDSPEEGEDARGPESRPARVAVRHALGQARAYLDSPPPPGRVRSSFASEDARTLRADGPGWSLVARTDDIAFVLLDEKPKEILPVERGPELPGLLTRLDALALRPEHS
ncbi:hypothetical protein PJ985_21350 [Streptomyces sp. ACA25]|nr:hypothetical protein [Streptomyces sp. ACA25]MDB1090107.1 hypothetical protein [Streptomyces sp. ACA25]